MLDKENNQGIAILTISGLGINAILLVLSVVFAKERVLFLDSAIYLFEMMNTESFFTPYRRFINISNQFLPWIGIKLHLKTNLLILLYSLNIQLVFSVLFLIISFGLKQKKLAFTIPLIQLILCYESFYLPISELGLGIAFLILLIALVRSKDRLINPVFVVSFLLVSLAVIFAHPILILPLGFIIFFELDILKDKSKFLKSPILLWASIALLIIIQYSISNQAYESERSGDLISSILKMSYYEIAVSFNTVIRYLLHFPLFILVALISFALLIKSKSWKILTLYIFASASCFFAISLYMHKIYFIMPFFEIYLLPISFLIAYTLIVHIKLHQKNLLILISLFMLIQTGLIANKSSFFKERISIYSSVLDQMKSVDSKKSIIDFYESPMRKIYTMYDTPYAPLLISKTRKDLPDMVFTFYVEEDIIDMEEINAYQAYLFLGFDNKVHPPKKITDLNPTYFEIDLDEYILLEADFSEFE